MNRLFLLLFGMVTFVAHAQVPDYVPTEGLVAWYPFNGNANDESGNGNDGVAENVTLENDRFGNPEAAFGFQGENCCGQPDDLVQQVVIENSIANLGDDYTVSTWFLSADLEKYQQCLFNSIPHTGFGVEYNNEHAPDVSCVGLGPGNAYWNTLYQHGPFAEYIENQWYHALFVKQNTNFRLYINGVLDWEATYAFAADYNLDVGIRFGSIGDGHEILNGSLDDCGIWNRALTESEILALYNAEPPGPGCTDPTACNYDAEATSDDGSCIPAGCMEPLACNYNALAECEGEACDYTCCPGPGCCLDGTAWDAELGGCVPNNIPTTSCPHDIDFDGLIGVVDLMDLLSVFGTDCPETGDPSGDPETIDFTCGEPVSYHSYDYATVLIGEQCWFAENLRHLPEVSPVALGSEDDGMPHAYVYGYNGSSPEEAMLTANYSTYGALYNYEAIDEWNLCPEGWSNPTLAKWNVLTSSHTAAECVSVEWFGNNQTGFNLLPGGDRDGVEGFNSFNNLGSAGLIWISDPPKHAGVLNQNWYEYENPTAPSFGFSIRCLKDQ